MPKKLKMFLFLLINLIISFNYVYAKNEDYVCKAIYNGNKINNSSKSFNEIIANCDNYVYRPSIDSDGQWKIVNNNSSSIKINTTLKTFSFSNLGNLKQNTDAQTVTSVYVTPKDTYSYTFIFVFLADNNTNSGRCCRSIENGNTKYSWNIVGSTCNAVSDITEENACLAKNGTIDTPTEDKEVCIQTGKNYHWGKLSTITAGSKEVVGLTKENCNSKMLEQAEKNNQEGNARVDANLANIDEDTTDTSNNNSGKYSCKNYQITRVRRYNPKDTNKGKTDPNIPVAKSDYFKSAVTKNSFADYYNVYKAMCTDSGEQVSTFCIDPGLTGPLSTPINYTASSSIDTTSDLGIGIGRLYAYWYKGTEGRSKIEAIPVKLSSGSFDQSTVVSDYVDYIVNNVARLLIYNYGSYNSPAIKFECDASNPNRCKDGWASDEISYFQKKDFSGNSDTTQESKNILTEIWNDITNYINNAKKSDSSNEIPIADDNWLIPVKSYVKLVGDFRSGASTGYYCNSAKGVATYNETEFSKNEKNAKNKHNGIDFTINNSDIGKIPVYAAQTGEVIAAGKISNDGSMGNAVVIVVKTADGKELKTRYLHLNSIESGIYAKAKATKINNKIVKKGDLIGYVGNTGKSSGPHLHFDISSNDASSKQSTGKTLYSPRDYLPLDSTEICSQKFWQQETPEVATNDSNAVYNSQAYKSLQLEKDNVSTNITNNGQGFEASFDIKLSSDDIDALNSITQNANWSITAETDQGDNIPISPSSVTLENNTFTSEDGGLIRKGKFKISVPNGLVGISGDAKKVKIKFNISYVSAYAVENIFLLTTTEYDKTNGKYQRFLTFLNGTINKYIPISIDIPDADNEECNPMFSMMCTPINTVSYLIEGTQSPEIFSKVMSGINTVGDLVKIVNKSTMILEKLKNNNLTSNDLLYIGSLAYNIAGDLINFTTIQRQLEQFLNLEELKDNKTAQRLKNTIVKDTTIKTNITSEKTDNGLWCTIKGWFGKDGKCYSDVEHKEEIKEIPDYTKDETRAFIDFAEMLSNAIKGNTDENYQSIKDDWKQISEVSSKYSEKYSKINSFVSTITNFVNGMKSKDKLNNVLDGLKTFGNSLLDGSIFETKPTLNDIKSTAENMSNAIQGTLQMATNSVGDIINQLKNIVANLDPKNMDLSDVSDVLSLFTKATTTDWEKCIIDNTDPAGNPYKVQDQNIYCSISCKEDYAFKMPGNLGTVAPGQNLTTNIDNIYQATVGVAGQRTCVTTSIDNSAYQKDAYDKKEEILDKYSELMKLYNQQRKVLSSDAGTTTPATWNQVATMPNNEIDKLIDIVESKLKDVFDGTMEEFAFQLLGSNSSAEAIGDLKAKLKEEGQQILVEVGGNIVANLLDGKNDLSDLMDGSLIREQFEKVFKEKAQEYKNTFDNALNSAVNYFVSHLKDVVTDAATAAAADVLKLGSAALLTAACHSTKLLNAIPYIGSALAAIGDGICQVYATVTTTVAPIVEKVSKATDGLILGYYTPASSSYTYRYSLYDYGTLPLTGLLTCSTDYAFKNSDDNYYTNVLKGDIVCIGTKTDTGNLKGNEIFIPVLKPSSYEPSVLQLGFTLNLSNLKTGVESIQSLAEKIPDLINDISGLIDPENSSFVNVLNAIGNPSLSSLKSILDYVVNGGFQKDADGLNNVFPTIFNYIASNSTYASTALTELIDTSLNAMYNLLGGFSPYYAEIANINNSLLSKKSEYNNLREELSTLATNMHDCTVWSNDFTFDPKITFNYGYRYFGAVKDTTTESIDLEMINKNETADETFYYCDDDVAINDIQSINTILSGRCTTSDGIIGAILSAFLGDNETFKGISSFISENSSIIRSFMQNDEVKKYLGNYYDQICLLAGEDLCVNMDDTLTTGIPGEIVYKMNNNASLKTTFDNLKSSFKLDNVKDGTIFAKFTNAIMSNFTYGPTKLDDVTYRNVGRVVRISRYGNPGVSISGLNMTRFIENMITYVANYLNVSRDSIVNKLYDALLSVTGEGAQKFIYFRSSKPYFTYSNKGIYTNDANESKDTIAIDYGDQSLYDDNIISGNDNAKTATGKSYPISLSTKEGTYYYNITFNNIGQFYNNNFSLGRIVDDDGYINGTMANEYACYYNVKTPDDKKDCDSSSDNCYSCEEKIENAKEICKTEDGKSFYKDLYKSNYNDLKGTDYQKKWTACVNELLKNKDKTCCNYIKDAIPTGAENLYYDVCDTTCRGVVLFACINSDSEACKDVNADSKEYVKNEGTSTNTAIINGNGALQFYTKVVSNYNLFPNGNDSKGTNWIGKTNGNENRDENGVPVGQKLLDIIKDIEDKGDNIYAEDPDYYIELSGACMSKIREYNHQQELNDLGFGDYTSSATNKETREFKSDFLTALQNDPEYSDCANYIENNLN